MADDDKGGKEPSCGDGDTVAIMGPTVGGLCPIVRHHADHSVEAGMARVISPEEAVSAPSALFLEHQRDNLFSVTTLSRGGSDGGVRKGPAKVSTQAYLNNWDNIFGKKPSVGQA
jgi:hypothetical protein